MNEDCGTAIIGSPYAWLRLTISLLLSTIAGIGMWSTVVALPAVQADFGIDRATASLPFTLAFGGYAFGGVLMGRLADRVGIVTPLTIGARIQRCADPSGFSRSPDRPCLHYVVVSSPIPSKLQLPGWQWFHLLGCSRFQPNQYSTSIRRSWRRPPHQKRTLKPSPNVRFTPKSRHS